MTAALVMLFFILGINFIINSLIVFNAFNFEVAKLQKKWIDNEIVAKKSASSTLVSKLKIFIYLNFQHFKRTIGYIFTFAKKNRWRKIIIIS